MPSRLYSWDSDQSIDGMEGYPDDHEDMYGEGGNMPTTVLLDGYRVAMDAEGAKMFSVSEWETPLNKVTAILTH